MSESINGSVVEQSLVNTEPGVLKILRALPGNLTTIVDERAGYGAPDNVVAVDVHLHVKSLDAYFVRTVICPITMEAHVRASNARMLALEGLESLTSVESIEVGQKIPVTVNPTAPAGIGSLISFVPAPAAQQATPEPATAAPAKPKRASRKEQAQPPVAEKPPVQEEQPPKAAEPPPEPTAEPPPEPTDEPAGDEPKDPNPCPQWPHETPAEDVLVAYGQARGQKVGSQSLDKLRWYSGTVPGRIRDKEQRELNAEERLMVQAASYLVDLNEWRQKRSGK